MEGGDYALGVFPESAIDFNLMDELLFDGCWLETNNDGINSILPGATTSSLTNNSPLYLPSLETKTDHFGANPTQMSLREADKKFLLPFAAPPRLKIEDVTSTTSADEEVSGNATSSSQPESYHLLEGAELGRSWWIAPRGNAYPNSSVKDRLIQAIGYIQQLMKERDFLIQIWVPVKRGGKNVLTTEEQPYSLNPDCTNLARYRDVSRAYRFAAEADSNESLGLPGRVFQGKLPEWTPDVRFFRSDEYPRISHAWKYDIRSSIALPVFEHGSGTCLGVIEIVTTTQKTNYRLELENVCRALEQARCKYYPFRRVNGYIRMALSVLNESSNSAAVDLRSSQDCLIPPSLKASNELYQAALPEVASVLESVCRLNKIPLALTWAPCIQQGKSGSRHSDENFSRCISTLDSACFITDEDSRRFLDACSDHHLLRGEGIVGRAFTTNKRCFATDVTAFSKTNYPLSHHARMFGLHAALAIPLRSVYTGLVELVLELFLPKDCLETERQKRMLDSLSTSVYQNLRSIHFLMEKEVEEEVIFPVREEMVNAMDKTLTSQENPTVKSETSIEESSWIAHMMEANRKGKGVCLSWEFQKEEPMEQQEFKVITGDWDSPPFDLHQKNSGDSCSSVTGQTLGGQRPSERRRTKTEKTISLEVLRQHFAGSLKDAAKNIGVCPTTLKRICRQYGIMRWPSRKIKKVGHSLKKLQLVMDSVQGVDGAFQLSSFYKSFPELSSPNLSMSPPAHNIISKPKTQPESGGTAKAPRSPSSSASQSTSSSSTCSSTGTTNMNTININASSSGNNTEDSSGLPKRPRSDAELLPFMKTSREHLALQTANLPPLPAACTGKDAIKIKAIFREAKVRISLQHNWGFRDLQREIRRRFKIEDASRFDLKYLDEDGEWVLLTCDTDLEECIDIYRSCGDHTIRISVHQHTELKLASFCSIRPSQ